MADCDTPLLVEEEEDEMEVAKAWRAVEALQLSVDLFSAVRQLQLLLWRVGKHSAFLSKDSTRRAIHRYCHCWLPLTRSCSDESLRTLQPPLDVQWVWLCHRLSPESYLRDCQAVIGRVIDGPLFPPSSSSPSHIPITCPCCSSGDSIEREAGAVVAPSDNASCQSGGSKGSRGPSGDAESQCQCARRETAAVAACRAMWDERWGPGEPYDVWRGVGWQATSPNGSNAIGLMEAERVSQGAGQGDISVARGRQRAASESPLAQGDMAMPGTDALVKQPIDSMWSRDSGITASISAPPGSSDGGDALSTVTDRQPPGDGEVRSREAGEERRGAVAPSVRDHGWANFESLTVSSHPPAAMTSPLQTPPSSISVSIASSTSISSPAQAPMGFSVSPLTPPLTPAVMSLPTNALPSPLLPARAPTSQDLALHSPVQPRSAAAAAAAGSPGLQYVVQGGGVRSAEGKGGCYSEDPVGCQAATVTYDLAAAMARQSKFLYQVDRTWMWDDAYTKGSIQRYRMFLLLLARHPTVFLSPTYDVDLVWHAHQMCTHAYARDCQHLAGRLIGHTDSVAAEAPALSLSSTLPVGILDQSPSSLNKEQIQNKQQQEQKQQKQQQQRRLEAAYRMTARLWEQTYGVPFDRAGSMRRKVPPPLPASAPSFDSFLPAPQEQVKAASERGAAQRGGVGKSEEAFEQGAARGAGSLDGESEHRGECGEGRLDGADAPNGGEAALPRWVGREEGSGAGRATAAGKATREGSSHPDQAQQRQQEEEEKEEEKEEKANTTITKPIREQALPSPPGRTPQSDDTFVPGRTNGSTPAIGSALVLSSHVLTPDHVPVPATVAALPLFVPLSLTTNYPATPLSLTTQLLRLMQKGVLADVNAGYGLKPRRTMEVHFMVWSLQGYTPPSLEHLHVVVRAQEAAEKFSCRTRTLPCHPPPTPSPPLTAPRPITFKQRWSWQVELSTKGLSLELLSESPSLFGSLFGPTVVAVADLTWQEALQQPGLTWDAQLPLRHPLADFGLPLTPHGTTASSFGTGRGGWGSKGSSPLAAMLSSRGGGGRIPSLHVSLSVTPPSAAPFLLRMVFAKGSDDSGAMVCEEVYESRGMRPQTGRWVSRTVMDHRDKEVLVVRKRVGKGAWHGRNRPQPVPPRERAIVVHKGGWSYIHDPHIPRGAVIDADLPHLLNGIAQGDIVAQAVPQASEDPETCQRFALIGCLPRQEIAYVTVTREKGQIIFMHGIRLDLRIDGQEEALLLPGRHLQYAVDSPSPSDERHFATLVRFPPDAPAGGVATALLNWKGGAVEVWPCESVLLALLLCVTIAEAVNEMVGVNRLRQFARVPLPPPNHEHHWDAVQTGSKGKKGEEGNEFVFSNIEDGRRCWWSRKPLKWAPGAANCGAGACGPSTVEFLALF